MQRNNGKKHPRAQKALRLEVGDTAVCPPHGVGQVVAIGPHEDSDVKEVFYNLKMRWRGLRIWVPAGRAVEMGVRQVIGRRDAERVYAILRQPARRLATGPWPRTCRDLADKLAGGSIFDAARIFRDLSRAKQGRELSVSAQSLLDRATHLVISELAAATGRLERTIKRKTEAILRPKQKSS